ncbi:hypothetical protein OGAPHI_004611 [Ogataea philodendri]|uniref:Uncharacterized protein n=1 Tax=Ogataea philodendri TaxID=1378263 RepID=A0A9P8P3Z7_9ASCO|nr:uncharacterized protein OGAPHI_004611 [Ogataea philodendri]KAH3664259.1 hypothetical protein OGAPHI_004611 [Ogataea philodendri]
MVQHLGLYKSIFQGQFTLASNESSIRKFERESNGFSTVQHTVIVGQSNVHHWTNLNLAVHSNRTFLDSVQSKNSSLWHVNNRGTIKRSENTSVGDGESSSGHIFQSQLSVTGTHTKLSNGVLDLQNRQALGVSNDRSDQSLRSGNGNRDINVVSKHHGVVVLDGSVNCWNGLHGQSTGLGESTHETKLDTSVL